MIPSLSGGPERIEERFDVEAATSPSGVTHATVARVTG